ncbi:GNAT family N-acetyltransferase [Sporosarcina thermotolerans]|uniref:GNAT family N-acetyltransferase n=1 Tax=Sporosarcina thermotolerans TaxID=633404 RepID=A0AAW9A515_9BACL|nr:GNAT family N-acetyltransferase [Sporosarcina thermotolerans]MDW0116232.1 GNAT family N-acetyltransferase [Sporosarcina thermotolerans]WHT48204.1 GNAT family N-acetyltransferase [Sporosarcina thermotolerans]
MSIQIRPALPTDADKVVPLIVDAIGDIANRLTGATEVEMVTDRLRELFMRNDNRHSYLYTYIAEINADMVGIIVLYPGDDAPVLDRNLTNWLMEKGALNPEIDAESLPGELYIDTVCISPTFRGKGIGTQLFIFVEELAKQQGYTRLALNVETQKDPAIRLYKRLGYEIVSPWTIIGEPFHHMVKHI